MDTKAHATAKSLNPFEKFAPAMFCVAKVAINKADAKRERRSRGKQHG